MNWESAPREATDFHPDEIGTGSFTINLDAHDLPDGLVAALRKMHYTANDAMAAIHHFDYGHGALTEMRDAIEAAMESIGLNVVDERCRNWPGYADHILEKAQQATEPDYQGDEE